MRSMDESMNPCLTVQDQSFTNTSYRTLRHNHYWKKTMATWSYLQSFFGSFYTGKDTGRGPCNMVTRNENTDERKEESCSGSDRPSSSCEDIGLNSISDASSGNEFEKTDEVIIGSKSSFYGSSYSNTSTSLPSESHQSLSIMSGSQTLSRSAASSSFSQEDFRRPQSVSDLRTRSNLQRNIFTTSPTVMSNWDCPAPSLTSERNISACENSQELSHRTCFQKPHFSPNVHTSTHKPYGNSKVFYEARAQPNREYTRSHSMYEMPIRNHDFYNHMGRGKESRDVCQYLCVNDNKCNDEGKADPVNQKGPNGGIERSIQYRNDLCQVCDQPYNNHSDLILISPGLCKSIHKNLKTRVKSKCSIATYKRASRKGLTMSDSLLSYSYGPYGNISASNAFRDNSFDNENRNLIEETDSEESDVESQSFSESLRTKLYELLMRLGKKSMSTIPKSRVFEDSSKIDNHSSADTSLSQGFVRYIKTRDNSREVYNLRGKKDESEVSQQTDSIERSDQWDESIHGRKSTYVSTNSQHQENMDYVVESMNEWIQEMGPTVLRKRSGRSLNSGLSVEDLRSKSLSMLMTSGKGYMENKKKRLETIANDRKRRDTVRGICRRDDKGVNEGRGRIEKYESGSVKSCGQMKGNENIRMEMRKCKGKMASDDEKFRCRKDEKWTRKIPVNEKCRQRERDIVGERKKEQERRLRRIRDSKINLDHGSSTATARQFYYRRVSNERKSKPFCRKNAFSRSFSVTDARTGRGNARCRDINVVCPGDSPSKSVKTPCRECGQKSPIADDSNVCRDRKTQSNERFIRRGSVFVRRYPNLADEREWRFLKNLVRERLKSQSKDSISDGEKRNLGCHLSWPNTIFRQAERKLQRGQEKWQKNKRSNKLMKNKDSCDTEITEAESSKDRSCTFTEAESSKDRTCTFTEAESSKDRTCTFTENDSLESPATTQKNVPISKTSNQHDPPDLDSQKCNTMQTISLTEVYSESCENLPKRNEDDFIARDAKLIATTEPTKNEDQDKKTMDISQAPSKTAKDYSDISANVSRLSKENEASITIEDPTFPNTTRRWNTLKMENEQFDAEQAAIHDYEIDAQQAATHDYEIDSAAKSTSTKETEMNIGAEHPRYSNTSGEKFQSESSNRQSRLSQVHTHQIEYFKRNGNLSKSTKKTQISPIVRDPRFPKTSGRKFKFEIEDQNKHTRSKPNSVKGEHSRRSPLLKEIKLSEKGTAQNVKQKLLDEKLEPEVKTRRQTVEVPLPVASHTEDSSVSDELNKIMQHDVVSASADEAKTTLHKTILRKIYDVIKPVGLKIAEDLEQYGQNNIPLMYSIPSRSTFYDPPTAVPVYLSQVTSLMSLSNFIERYRRSNERSSESDKERAFHRISRSESLPDNVRMPGPLSYLRMQKHTKDRTKELIHSAMIQSMFRNMVNTNLRKSTEILQTDTENKVLKTANDEVIESNRISPTKSPSKVFHKKYSREGRSRDKRIPGELRDVSIRDEDVCSGERNRSIASGSRYLTQKTVFAKQAERAQEKNQKEKDVRRKCEELLDPKRGFSFHTKKKTVPQIGPKENLTDGSVPEIKGQINQVQAKLVGNKREKTVIGGVFDERRHAEDIQRKGRKDKEAGVSHTLSSRIMKGHYFADQISHLLKDSIVKSVKKKVMEQVESFDERNIPLKYTIPAPCQIYKKPEAIPINLSHVLGRLGLKRLQTDKAGYGYMRSPSDSDSDTKADSARSKESLSVPIDPRIIKQRSYVKVAHFVSAPSFSYYVQDMLLSPDGLISSLSDNFVQSNLTKDSQSNPKNDIEGFPDRSDTDKSREVNRQFLGRSRSKIFHRKYSREGRSRERHILRSWGKFPCRKEGICDGSKKKQGASPQSKSVFSKQAQRTLEREMKEEWLREKEKYNENFDDDMVSSCYKKQEVHSDDSKKDNLEKAECIGKESAREGDKMEKFMVEEGEQESKMKPVSGTEKSSSFVGNMIQLLQGQSMESVRTKILNEVESFGERNIPLRFAVPSTMELYQSQTPAEPIYMSRETKDLVMTAIGFGQSEEDKQVGVEEETRLNEEITSPTRQQSFQEKIVTNISRVRSFPRDSRSSPQRAPEIFSPNQRKSIVTQAVPEQTKIEDLTRQSSRKTPQQEETILEDHGVELNRRISLEGLQVEIQELREVLRRMSENADNLDERPNEKLLSEYRRASSPIKIRPVSENVGYTEQTTLVENEKKDDIFRWIGKSRASLIQETEDREINSLQEGVKNAATDVGISIVASTAGKIVGSSVDWSVVNDKERLQISKTASAIPAEASGTEGVFQKLLEGIASFGKANIPLLFDPETQELIEMTPSAQPIYISRKLRDKALAFFGLAKEGSVGSDWVCESSKTTSDVQEESLQSIHDDDNDQKTESPPSTIETESDLTKSCIVKGVVESHRELTFCCPAFPLTSTRHWNVRRQVKKREYTSQRSCEGFTMQRSRSRSRAPLNRREQMCRCCLQSHVRSRKDVWARGELERSASFNRSGRYYTKKMFKKQISLKNILRECEKSSEWRMYTKRELNIERNTVERGEPHSLDYYCEIPAGLNIRNPKCSMKKRSDEEQDQEQYGEQDQEQNQEQEHLSEGGMTDFQCNKQMNSQSDHPRRNIQISDDPRRVSNNIGLICDKRSRCRIWCAQEFSDNSVQFQKDPKARGDHIHNRVNDQSREHEGTLEQPQTCPSTHHTNLPHKKTDQMMVDHLHLPEYTPNCSNPLYLSTASSYKNCYNDRQPIHYSRNGLINQESRNWELPPSKWYSSRFSKQPFLNTPTGTVGRPNSRYFNTTYSYHHSYSLSPLEQSYQNKIYPKPYHNSCMPSTTTSLYPDTSSVYTPYKYTSSMLPSWRC